MKNSTQILCVLLFVVGNIFAQQEKGIIGANNWLNNWTEFKPNHTDYGEPTQILTGNITKDTKLNKRDVYLLLGSVFVTDSTTLTIEPGTVILGDFDTNGSLTISKGSKIIAEGTQTDPIIFTSNRSVKKQGDWGGVFVLGDAPINKYGNGSSVEYGLRPSSYENISYGGDNTESNSGILKYVRIEYCGFGAVPDSEVNGLSLYAVGSKTTIDYVQVYKCTDDGFEFFGGTVNATHLISMYNDDDSFDMDQGWRGKGQFWLAVQAPGADNGFESDGRAKLGEGDATRPTLYNVTLVGFGKDGKDDKDKNYGMRLREDFEGELHNFVITNFAGINFKLENKKEKKDDNGNVISSEADATEKNYTTDNKLVIDNILVANNNLVNAQAYDGFKSDEQKADFIKDGKAISYVKETVLSENYALKSSVQAPAYKANVPAGIEAVDFIGAIGSTDWTANWSRKKD